MKNLFRVASGAVSALALVALLAPTGAGAVGLGGPPNAGGADHVVFVQTDNIAGNQIAVYDRTDTGALTLAHTVDTGGLGGALNGAVVDFLASQGSLAYDRANALLYAANAGSNTISVFSVAGDVLSLRQVLDSGGSFPVSIAVHDRLVYVLNARDGGSVAGFGVAGGTLHPIEGSTRALDLVIPTDASEFTHTPGQVLFSPDGTRVIVTTKASSDAIDVFTVNPNGRLSDTPVVNVEAGTVPFAATFDGAGHLVVANAGDNSLATYILNLDGTVTPVESVGTGQAATCWVASAQGYFFTSNAGSSSLSGFQVAPNGHPTLLATTPTDGGTVDAAASADGQFLYVQTGAAGIVDAFRVNANGTLTAIGSVTVANAAGGEGIVAI